MLLFEQMQYSRIFLVFPVMILSAFAYNAFTGGCNEAVCGSIVSKCMLMQSCKCDAKNTTCSKDCFYCLDKLYLECCTCVGTFNSIKKSVLDKYLSS